MRSIVDVRCENGHFAKDVWVEIGQGPGKPLPINCVECTGLVFRADAPRISPQGIPADREVDILKPEKVDTNKIAAETAKEIEEKWNRFSDPVVAEEVIGREVDEHIHDPLPEAPPLEFPVVQATDRKTGEQTIQTVNLDTGALV